MTTVQQIQATRVALSAVEESPWNVNVVPPDKFARLKADMKASGPGGTDPIDTCVLGKKRYTCDGAHRLRAARQLGWDCLYEIFHPEIVTEEQARLFNYKRDADRGDIDPFKLAVSFKWFVDQGLKQEQIAEKFGVDRSTVSHRLSLLNVDEEVKKQVITDTRMGVSHLEPLASLPAELQPKALAEVRSTHQWQKDRPITVRDVTEAALKVKQEDAKEQAFQKLLKDPRVKDEFRRCPGCKAKPVEQVTERYYLWPGAELVVKDERFHLWSLVTGPQPEEKPGASRRSPSGSSRPPQHEKSKVRFEVYEQAIRNFFDAVWPRITDVDSLEWSGKTAKSGRSVALSGKDLLSVSAFGKLDGKRVSLDVSTNSVEFGKVSFLFEENRTANKEFSTYVRVHGTLLSRKALHELEEEAVRFLEEYGRLPRDQNPDWLRIQKREGKARKVPHGTKGKSERKEKAKK